MKSWQSFSELYSFMIAQAGKKSFPWAEVLPDPVLLCSSDGQILWVTKRVRETLLKIHVHPPRVGQKICEWLGLITDSGAYDFNMTWKSLCSSLLRRTYSARNLTVHVNGSLPLHLRLATFSETDSRYILVHLDTSLRLSPVLTTALLEDLPVLMAITDRALRFIWINRSFREMLGIDCISPIGKRMSDIPILQDNLFMQNMRKECHKTKKPQSAQVTLHIGKHRIILDALFTPVLDHSGTVRYSIGIHRDITKLQKAQNSRDSVYEILNSLLERIPVGFIALDSSLSIIRANSAACRLYGYHESSDMLGLKAENLVPKALKSHFLSELNKFSLRDDSLKSFSEKYESAALNKDGKQIPVLTSILKMKMGEYPILALMLVDISEIRSAEKQIQEAQEKIQQMQKHEALGQLAGNIAHDFNNLMAIILGYADAILETKETLPEISDMTSEIKKAVIRGSGLTKQILAYAKHQNLEVAVVDIKKLILDQKNMLKAALSANVNLIFSFDDTPYFVNIDETQFTQVIMNLIINARDAMPDGGNLIIEIVNSYLDETFFMEKSIHSQPGDYIKLSVRDSGTGIPEEVQRFIFDPYFSTKPRDKGTGLGLSVVYGIVKQMEGFIFCKSKPGQGTEFQILLPRQNEIHLTKKTDSIHENGNLDLSQYTILVVEDETPLRKVVVKQLTGAGFQVYQAESGRKALDFIDSYAGNITIILSDIMMPEMSGLDMAQEAMLMQPEASVIFMSGYSKDLLRTKKPRGDFRLLTKPFSKEALLAEILSVIRERGNT